MTLTLQPNINLHTLNTVNQTYQPQLLFNDYKQGMKPVSYTHLDVYKRQAIHLF